DGKTLAMTAGHAIALWDSYTGKRLVPCTEVPKFPVRVIFSPNGNLMAALYWGQPLRIFETASRKQLLSLTFRNEIRSPAFSPDGKLAFTELAGTKERLDGSYVRFLDAATGKEVQMLPKQPGVIEPFLFSPRGDCVAGQCQQEIVIWD